MYLLLPLETSPPGQRRSLVETREGPVGRTEAASACSRARQSVRCQMRHAHCQPPATQ